MRFIYIVVAITGLSTLRASAQSDQFGYSDRDVKLLKGVEYRYGMFKLNVANLMFKSLDVAYERRINMNFSAVIRSNLSYGWDRKGYGLSAGARYYLNLERRILKRYDEGKTTPCFNATYAQVDFMLVNRTGPDFVDNKTNGFSAGPSLVFGMQRRFWKYCYFDVNAGLRTLPGVVSGFTGMVAVGVGI